MSDTFIQFAKPLMQKLGWPTILCNELEVAPDGRVTGFRMRCEQTKLTTVRAFQSMGYETVAFGDSFNDIEMLEMAGMGYAMEGAPEPVVRAAGNVAAPNGEDGVLGVLDSLFPAR